MSFRYSIIATALCIVLFRASYPAYAVVVSGTISEWHESGSVKTIGDGVNHVRLYWSLNYYDRGYFYGSRSTADSDVAFATGVTDILQIADASIFNFNSAGIGPYRDADSDPDGVGDFMVWRNINTGHFGVLRVDDIDVVDLYRPTAYLTGTWWFQTDGTGDFSQVPEPSSLLLFLFALARITVGVRKHSSRPYSSKCHLPG